MGKKVDEKGKKVERTVHRDLPKRIFNALSYLPEFQALDLAKRKEIAGKASESIRVKFEKTMSKK